MLITFLFAAAWFTRRRRLPATIIAARRLPPRRRRRRLLDAACHFHACRLHHFRRHLRARHMLVLFTVFLRHYIAAALIFVITLRFRHFAAAELIFCRCQQRCCLLSLDTFRVMTRHSALTRYFTADNTPYADIGIVYGVVVVTTGIEQRQYYRQYVVIMPFADIEHAIVADVIADAADYGHYAMISLCRQIFHIFSGSTVNVV